MIMTKITKLANRTRQKSLLPCSKVCSSNYKDGEAPSMFESLIYKQRTE